MSRSEPFRLNIDIVANFMQNDNYREIYLSMREVQI